jgi:hypothetical protein
LKARTAEALLDAIGVALRAVTTTDAEGWFAHCGYGNTEWLVALIRADDWLCRALHGEVKGLSHGVSPIVDSFSRNSSGVSLRNSQKLKSGNFKPSRP